MKKIIFLVLLFSNTNIGGSFAQNLRFALELQESMLSYVNNKTQQAIAHRGFVDLLNNLTEIFNSYYKRKGYHMDNEDMAFFAEIMQHIDDLGKTL